MEEYYRKLNELELEKEELEYYKRKYKRKLEQLNQEKRNYQHKVKEIVKKATPKHTEETSSEDVADLTPPTIKITDEHSIRYRSALQRENYGQIKELVEGDLFKLRKEKHKSSLQKKIGAYSQGKLSDIAKSLDMAHIPNMKKSSSDVKVYGDAGKFTADWQEVELIKKKLLGGNLVSPKKNKEMLELKYDLGKPITSPRRAATLLGLIWDFNYVELATCNYIHYMED